LTVLTCLRGLAEELQLDFEKALTESDAAYEDQFRQAFERSPLYDWRERGKYA